MVDFINRMVRNKFVFVVVVVLYLFGLFVSRIHNYEFNIVSVRKI